MKNVALVRVGLLSCAALLLGGLGAGCASDQRSTATAEEVRDGEAIPPAPPVPAEPAATDSPTAATVPAGAGVAEPTPSKEMLTEAQIAKVSELVNTAEVEQGKLAQGKAKAANVKSFAAMMVKHHGEALKEQAKLVKKLSLTAADSATASKLKTSSDKALESLKNVEPTGFDAAYMASQVEGHQMALQLLDEQLLPSAKTPEVTDALRRARTIVAEHLEQAKALQAK